MSKHTKAGKAASGAAHQAGSSKSASQASKQAAPVAPVLVIEEVEIVGEVVPSAASPGSSIGASSGSGIGASSGASARSASVTATPTMATGNEVAKLNEFLRAELAAVETYDLAMKNVKAPEVVAALQQLRDSHATRAHALSSRVLAYGGQPSESSGISGVFRRLLQRGADLFGDRAALAALEQDEDHLRRLYNEDLEQLDQSTQDFTRMQLAPEQQRSHDLAYALEQHVKVL